MKYLNQLLVLAAMLLPMSVGAQESSKKYLNLYYKSGDLYIGLYNKGCTVENSDDGTCVFSEQISSTNMVRTAFEHALENGNWVTDDADKSKYESTVLNLATDIDFGQTLGVGGICSEDLDSLSFKGATFDGKNHVISNLCHLDKGYMDAPVGLFGKISGGTVKNLTISNVYFAVADEYPNGDPASTSGGDYHAVGTLASRISNSKVVNVKLNDVVIQAPLAGGLAGYIENSTITGISTIGSSFIKVSNERQIEDGYVGSTIYSSGVEAVVFKSYKVLLGGLAGAAFFTNFSNVDIAVQVKNEVPVDLSSLGGLVGHYVYAPTGTMFTDVTDRNSKIDNVKIHGAPGTDYVKSVVSGGTAMGGVLGTVRRLDEHNSPILDLVISKATVANQDIKQSKIKIKDSDEKQSLYFGGIIGKGDLCSGGVLQIEESNVENVNIEEMIQENAAFQYYMGGIAGYASCSHLNNSGSRKDLYLTLQKSKAIGSITLGGGYSKAGKASSQVRASAMMGGLVGDAILSIEDNGTAENESYVSINYNAKRADNDVDVDSVLVGGIFGAVSLFSSSPDYVRLTNLSYKGLLKIDDDGIIARVGGIVGEYPLNRSGNPKIEFNDVHVEGDLLRSLVSYSGESKASSNTSSSIGGICGVCLSPREISESSVEGDFEGTDGNEAAPKKDFHVGGLVGLAVVANGPIVVKNNYFVGTTASKFNKGEGKGKVGYLFGSLTGDGLGAKPQITSNFHYGEDNVGAVGFFSNYGEFSNSVYLDELVKFDAKNNVRNGNKMDLNVGGNGYATADYMKSRDMAVFLNSPWTEAEDQVWTFGTNRDYPYIGTPAILTYTVRFLDENGDELKTLNVGFGSVVEAPEAPKIKDKCFAGWSESFDKVLESMDIYAQYNDGVCKYTVTFNDFDGLPLENVVVEEGKAAIAPEGPDPTSDGLCFDGWDSGENDYTNVTKNMTVNAKSKTCEYTVTFTYLNADGTSRVKDSQIVAHNKAATPPGSDVVPQETDDGQCFVGWDTDANLDKITGDLEIPAKYETCPSSSSSEESSSSEAESSSSVEESSSSAIESSSSSVESSSSVLVVSSSSVQSSSSVFVASSSSAKGQSSSSSESQKYLREIARPTVKQEGNALRMTFKGAQSGDNVQVDYHVVVISETGIYLDTVVEGKNVSRVKKGTWRLEPAPVGKYTVNFTLTDGSDSVSYNVDFNAEREKRVELASNSWQTYSLSAFCRGKGDKCKNDLKKRFSGQETSVFWWDELNPVGDYWQYRRLSMDDELDSVRGYWYGPHEDEPLVLSLQTPRMNDEVVWKLENEYSGWNLVANPFGWNIKLLGDESVAFWKWNPISCEYVKADTLGPYEAVWAYTDKAREYRIPLKAAIILEGEKKALTKRAEAEDWNLRVVLADDNGKRDSWNELAVGSKASSLKEPPAGMGDRVNLSIVEGQRRLAKSVKQNGDELEWNLEASATTSRDGQLRFVGLESVRAKGMRVYATVDDETFEVADDRPLDVKLSKKAKKVAVRVTSRAVMAEAVNAPISGFRVNQASNTLDIGFDAVSKLAGAKVKVSVVGVDGRVVATSGAVAREGSNAVSMKKPKQGVYFVRLKVGSQTAVNRVLVH